MFIQTSQVRVPPFLIFPFDSTDNEDLKREGNGHVLLSRFAVYAYPTYIESPFPAFLYYTGLPTDCAIGYPFSAVEGRVCKSLINLGNRFTTLPTTSGSIFQLDPEEIEKNSMILVNDGDYSSRINDISTISSLLLMVQKRVKKPSIELIDVLLKELMESWRLTQIPTRSSVFSLIKQMQENLIENGCDIEEPNGVITPKTVKAVKALMPGFRNEFFINLKVFNFIMRLVPQKKKQ